MNGPMLGWITYLKDNQAGITKWQGQFSKIPDYILFQKQGYLGMLSQDQFTNPLDGSLSLVKVKIS